MDSEKLIEKTLNDEVKKLGGWSLKLPCVYVAGLPDRLVLLPGGVVFFAELKSAGKKPTLLQQKTHERLRSLGFDVYLIDTLELLYTALNRYLL